MQILTRNRRLLAIMVVATICALTALWIMARWGRDRAYVMVSTTAMFNVSEVLREYHRRHGRLPAAQTLQHGYPHSWRTQADNAARERNGMEIFNLAEPWDSKFNLSLSYNTAAHGGYDLCCSHPRHGMTNYFVIVGDETAFPGTRGIFLDEILDGLENTVLVIETRGSQIPWPQPEDIAFAELESIYHGKHQLSIESHSRGTGLLFADLQRFFLVKKPSFEKFQALFTRSGGEPWTRAQLIDEGFLVPMGIRDYTWQAEGSDQSVRWHYPSSP